MGPRLRRLDLTELSHGRLWKGYLGLLLHFLYWRQAALEENLSSHFSLSLFFTHLWEWSIVDVLLILTGLRCFILLLFLKANFSGVDVLLFGRIDVKLVVITGIVTILSMLSSATLTTARVLQWWFTLWRELIHLHYWFQHRCVRLELSLSLICPKFLCSKLLNLLHLGEDFVNDVLEHDLNILVTFLSKLGITLVQFHPFC